MSRSCTSSIITWVMPASDWSCIMRRSSTPVVTNSTEPPSLRGGEACSRTLNPMEFPMGSERSLDTRSATLVAAMRRGCVTMMRVSAPLPFLMASSRMYCGHCVDLPLPVPPLTTTTGESRSASTRLSRILMMGSLSRTSCILASLEPASWAAAARDSSCARNLAFRAADASGVSLAPAPPVLPLCHRSVPSPFPDFPAPPPSSSSSMAAMDCLMTRFSAARVCRMRASWSSGVPIELIRASMASSGSGGRRSAATLPPGAFCMMARYMPRRSGPITSTSWLTHPPYAWSSASPLLDPLPVEATFLPPST
mmetsp:Transcript_16644/g.40777  ORF Transcript_16644/g.40777 Transcript_16644/m.40777 type:complete len:310 (-) Transcript_16644:1104-2033(-)